MSHHGREDEDRNECGLSCAQNANMLKSAVNLITALSKGVGLPNIVSTCDAWLDSNGFDCAASRKRQRERRAEQLDAEIERLRKERAAL